MQPALMESTVFPLPFQSHLIFCVIATIFFVIQFIRLRRTYQLVFAVAIPATMLLYVSESRTWFYGIGVFELAMLILAVIMVCIDHAKAKKDAPKEPAEKEADA